MAKLSNLIEEVLYEKSSQKSLKCFYDVRIFLQEFEKDIPPEEPAQQEQPPQEVPAPAPEVPAEEPVAPEQEELAASTQEKEKPLNEEIFKVNTEGTLVVEAKKAKNILTLNDLLAYMNREEDERGREIFNDLVVETILALAGEETQKSVEEILDEGDRMNVIVDYGFDEDDSIGFQVNKNPGVKMATLIMRKDGAPFGSGQFNMAIFNQTLTNIFVKEVST